MVALVVVNAEFRATFWAGFWVGLTAAAVVACGALLVGLHDTTANPKSTTNTIRRKLMAHSPSLRPD
jgi:hypothetical protein